MKFIKVFIITAGAMNANSRTPLERGVGNTNDNFRNWVQTTRCHIYLLGVEQGEFGISSRFEIDWVKQSSK